MLSLSDSKMSTVFRLCLRRQHQLSASRFRCHRAQLIRDNVLSPVQVGHHYFSDRALGYSPMAQSSTSASSATAKMPTAQDVTTSGGVWAPTSAKRDKMSELLLALEEGQSTLDDAATPEQLLDLYLADGLDAIVKAAERDTSFVALTSVVQDVDTWMEEKAIELPEDLRQVQWETYLRDVSRKAASLASDYPAGRCLRNVRDFYERKPTEPETERDDELVPSVDQVYEDCVILYRFKLLQAEADQLLESWDTLTRVSDADIDRAAVKGVALDSQASILPLSKLNNVLRSFVVGTCEDRVAATWDLMDRDGDGLVEDHEMDQVAYMVVNPIENSLKTLFQAALKAYPVRASLDSLDKTGQDSESSTKKGWRARRREKRAEKRLQRIFNNTLQTHFRDEVEMPHRLRCIYAWANKAHQDNRIDSIHVETSDWGSRQRYVELQPKISLEEFKEVQKEHFSHLDRVGQDLVKSFRENLLVDQGKGRQNSELKRDCLAFLAVVSVIDFIILSL